VTERRESGLSTTALARELNLPAQQLFVTLRDFGWIRRGKDGWLLTARGEYEGGRYHDSSRYGRYIIWPRQLLQHHLLTAIESNERLTAVGLCHHFPGLSSRRINRALAELGLQYPGSFGWELTALGRSRGGMQEEDENNGVRYVSWPRDFADDPVVRRELGGQSEQLHPVVAVAGGDGDHTEPDLFADEAGNAAHSLTALDGHRLRTLLQLRVCNWLYLAQLTHAHRRALPVEEEIDTDFYVPSVHTWIDCWEEDVDAAALARRLRKREVCGELGLRYVEVNAGDEEQLEHTLRKGLLF